MNDQEKIYNRLIDSSFECKSINDVQILIDVFNTNKWGDTNYRMLKWVLEQRLSHFQQTKTANSELKEGRENFLNLHMN